jgi:hypothetical protein
MLKRTHLDPSRLRTGAVRPHSGNDGDREIARGFTLPSGHIHQIGGQSAQAEPSGPTPSSKFERRQGTYSILSNCRRQCHQFFRVFPTGWRRRLFIK